MSVLSMLSELLERGLEVVRNGLISYCRQICRHEPVLPLLEECQSGDGPEPEASSHLEQEILDLLIREDLFRALHKAHRRSSGVVRLGIEAAGRSQSSTVSSPTM